MNYDPAAYRAMREKLERVLGMFRHEPATEVRKIEYRGILPDRRKAYSCMVNRLIKIRCNTVQICLRQDDIYAVSAGNSIRAGAILRRHGIDGRAVRSRADWIEPGTEFGRLQVAERIADVNGALTYSVRCLRCGLVFRAQGAALKKRKNPTCGCVALSDLKKADSSFHRECRGDGVTPAWSYVPE